MKKITRPLLLALLGFVLFGCSKSEWTAKEIKAWHARYATNSTHYGLLYYAGSDEDYHHFRIRAIDNWVVMRVKLEEIAVREAKPRTSSAPFPGYYAVDPLNGFEQIKTKN